MERVYKCCQNWRDMLVSSFEMGLHAGQDLFEKNANNFGDALW